MPGIGDSVDIAFGEGPDWERLRAVYQYWSRKRRGREMPSRADLDPSELKPFLAQLLLIDVEHNPLRFRYRLVGTEVTRMRAGASKIDPTGCYVDEVTHHQGTPIVIAHYRRVVEERKPSFAIGTFKPPDRLARPLLRLALPLSDDGKTINMILAILVPAL